MGLSEGEGVGDGDALERGLGDLARASLYGECCLFNRCLLIWLILHSSGHSCLLDTEPLNQSQSKSKHDPKIVQY